MTLWHQLVIAEIWWRETTIDGLWFWIGNLIRVWPGCLLSALCRIDHSWLAGDPLVQDGAFTWLARGWNGGVPGPRASHPADRFRLVHRKPDLKSSSRGYVRLFHDIHYFPFYMRIQINFFCNKINICIFWIPSPRVLWIALVGIHIACIISVVYVRADLQRKKIDKHSVPSADLTIDEDHWIVQVVRVSREFLIS